MRTELTHVNFFQVYVRPLILAVCVLCFYSCEKDRNKIGAEYNGPIEIVNQVEITYSEQGLQKVQMLTQRSLTYSNQNKVFPDTVNINFFEPTGEIVTRLRADSGRFDQATNVYIVKGHVRVVKPDEILTTTELSWNPGTKKVFTDKPLTIRRLRASELIRAVGMDAEQDFTRIKLRKGNGTIKFSGAP